MEVADMKKMIVLLLLAALALTGCASGNFLGLATTGYVDAKEKAMADQEAETTAKIEQLKSQLAEVQAMKDQAQAAVDQMNQTQKVVQDLQALAQRAEARIGAIPKEVIKQIVDILQASLQQ
jgi:outer membrane murein-binding lipoprotein Lpp